MPVDILMATFNGEKYLRNQILSLQQQTYDDWKLHVRDDGSTDNTVKILELFAKSDKRIIFNSATIGKNNLGPAKSFLELTSRSSADYAIFCDQDDIWFERKIEILHEYANRNFNPDTPSLVYCDGYGYADKAGIVSVNSISQMHAKNMNEFIFFNAGYQGCSMLFNKKLCKMMATYDADYFFMHDGVASLLAHAFGEVKFLPKRLMLYRQHDSNVTGNITSGFCLKFLSAIRRKTFVISEKHYREKKSFYSAYKEKLPQELRIIFEAYLSYPHINKIGRLMLILRYGFSLGGSKLKLIIKTLIRKPLE